MKKHARIVSVVIGIALAAATANADITVFSGAVYDVVITDPVPVGASPGGEDLFGFDLRIINTTGDPSLNPAGFNGSTPQETKPGDPSAWPSMPTYSGFTTATPAFHNQYLMTIGTSPTFNDPNFATDIDTHFNFRSDEMMSVGMGPSETNGLAGLPTGEPFNSTGPWAQHAMTDFGDRLYGLFAIVGGAAADIDGDGDPTVWRLAYFAVPRGTTVHMDFYMTAINPGEVITGSFVVIPEPATMSMLALGGLALLRKRGKA